jgi:hypothetical protein
MINVPRTASTADIRRAWKDMSKILHPDVNAASDANDMFIKLGKVKDTLTSEADRRVYDRWGPKFFEHPAHNAWLANPAGMAFLHFQEYGGLMFMAFIATMQESRKRAFWWIMAMLGALFFYEMMLKYDDDDWDYMVAILPQWTIYEKVQLLHVTAFFMINLLTNWANRTYVDMEVR